MKEYTKPEIFEEKIELEDVIATSGSFGSVKAGEVIVDIFGPEE